MYKQSDFVLTDDWMVNSEINIVKYYCCLTQATQKSLFCWNCSNNMTMTFIGLKLQCIWNAKTTQFPVEGARFLSEDCFPTAEEVHSFLKPFSQKQKKKKEGKRPLYIILADFLRKYSVSCFVVTNFPKTLICICLIKKIRIIQS